MRIAVMTVGSRGDVQPYLALAVGLRRRGHQVTLTTHETFRSLVEGRGIGFAPLPGDPREVLRSREARRVQASGGRGIRFVRRFVGLLEPWFWQFVEAAAPIHRAADLVVYTPLAFAPWHLSQADGTPTVLASLQPFTPTREMPAPFFSGPRLGGWANLASHHLARQLFWQPVRRLVNEWRTRDLGLPPLPLLRPWTDVLGEEPEVDGYSTVVVPRPSDWPERVHVTGYWFLEDERSDPDPALAAFLADGPPPVYAGFGSTDPGRAEELAEVAVAAARQAGTRLLLGSGWAGLAAEGDDVATVGDVPHSWLFPRTAAVVHHGGAGTTGSGLRAGRPTVVVPFYADQPFWGSRVEAIGAGPRPVPARRLEAGRLADALRRALGEPVRRRAEEVGRRIRSEDGVAAACTVIERVAER